ncbi:MAG: right-handed parallel beta-helix repeat-containing protein, partial [Verrucomicrobiota bacterium]
LMTVTLNFAFLIFNFSLLAQGSLTPPGAPAPTMKTLEQVEPRTPINTLPFVIAQSGSYYLTKSFAQNFSGLDAITIQADNVTVDFCGFTIRQTNATPSIVGVRIGAIASSTPLRNAVIKNGTIAGFAAVGITSLGGRNCLIENLHITGCAGGITFQAYGTAGAAANTFRRCRMTDNASGSGIVILSGAGNVGNTIENCESLNNSTGFAFAAAGNLIIGCRASGNVINYTIAPGNRGGVIVLPTPNATQINSATSGLGTGVSDPFANLSF